jgi:hypothetical protein
MPNEHVHDDCAECLRRQVKALQHDLSVAKEALAAAEQEIQRLSKPCLSNANGYCCTLSHDHRGVHQAKAVDGGVVHQW